MEINQNNENQLNSQKDIYKSINELSKKYEILEKQYKRNEELLDINKTNILTLNLSLSVLNNTFLEFKGQYDKDILDLQDKVKKIIEVNKENQKAKNNQINIGEINDLKAKYGEMIQDMNKRFEDMKIQIRDIKIKNVELKISDENKGENVFNDFQNTLAQIIDKKVIDNESKEELKRISEKLIKNDTSPVQYANNFFKENYKYLPKDIENLKLEGNNIFEMQKKIAESLISIEDEIRQKKATPIESKKKRKKK